MVERLRGDGQPGEGALGAHQRGQGKSLDFEQYEVLLGDYRVERIADAIRQRYPHRLDNATFVSFIQPSGAVPVQSSSGLIVMRRVPAKAVFAVLAPDPRPWKRETDGILVGSHMDLSAWKSLESERAHFVSGKQDIAYTPFLRAAMEVMDKVQSASEQIN